MDRRILVTTLLLVGALPLSAQERVTSGQRAQLTDERVEIFNAVGTITMRKTSGNAVTVTATAQGSDGSQLVFETDHTGNTGRFRVVYPDVEAIAGPPELTRYSSTDLDLRRDGTFGGNDDSRHHGDRVRVGGTRGLQAWAAVEIGIPDGKNVKVHLAAGRATADGVNATVLVDTWGANTEATNIAGDWMFDTGSGNASVRGMRGTLRFDTGSGDVTASNVTGDLLDCDTGSGDVDVTDVQVDRFNFDTGSGDVKARNLTARRGVVDTGSGDADIVYTGGTIEDLSIDTGSGKAYLTMPPNADARVSIETGGGDATVQRSGAIFERRDEDTVVLRFGQGRGKVRIDTGSGDVVIR
jgi:DUF4097 and DUF4098 domain-containing protein YvlB